jgi:release factor glutamine methyltransferase
VELHAADLDPAAVRCARRNLAGAGGRVYEGDLFAPLPAGLRGRVDVLAANVPYVPTGDIPLLPSEARDHEATLALDGGADGLDAYRAIAAAAPRLLARGGRLLLELGAGQSVPVSALIAAAGMSVLAVRTDLGSRPRVLVAA